MAKMEFRGPPRRSLSYYSQRRILGIILPFSEWGSRVLSGERRSLTAAQAATEFTRNCVSGFERKLVTFGRSVIRGFAECFQWHFAYLFPYFFQGIPVPLSRYGERHALFISARRERIRESSECRGERQFERTWENRKMKGILIGLLLMAGVAVHAEYSSYFYWQVDENVADFSYLRREAGGWHLHVPEAQGRDLLQGHRGEEV